MSNRQKMLVLISAVLVVCMAGTARAQSLKVEFNDTVAYGAGDSPAGWYTIERNDIWSQGGQDVFFTFNGTDLGDVTIGIKNNSGVTTLAALAVGSGWENNYEPAGDLASVAKDALHFVCDEGCGATPAADIGLSFSGLVPYTLYQLTTYHTYFEPPGYGGAAEPVTVSVGGVVQGTVTPGTPDPVNVGTDMPYIVSTFVTDGTGAYSDIAITALPDSDATGVKKMNGFTCGFELTRDADQPVIGFELADSNGLEDEVSTALIDVELLNPAEGETYTVEYAVIGGTADGNDYTLTTPSPLVFDPCDTVKTISIDITDDGTEEPDETIILELSNPSSGAILADPNVHTYTILDPRPKIIWDPESVLKVDLECGKQDASNLGSPEGWSVLYGPDGYSATFGDIVVSFTNETGHGSLGISYNSYGGDYIPSGELAAMVQDHMYIHDSESGDQVRIRMELEGLDKNKPYLMTTWHNSGYNNLAAPGMIDILVGETEVVSNLQQSHSVSNSDNAAKAEFGFTADANGMATIYFIANNTSSGGAWAPDNVVINGFELMTDTSEAIFEFVVTESGEFEDEPPLSIDVKLSYPPYEQTYTVDYEVIGGTATEVDDYTLTAGTLVFDPCETIKSISFDNIVNDGVDEDDETVILRLYNPSLEALLVNAEHTYTIIDIRPKISFAVAESNGLENATPVLIEVNLNRDDYIKGTTRDTITVDYAVTGGTADEDKYVLPPGTLVFPPGVLSQYISLEPLDDDEKIQPDETVVITLSSPTGPGVLGDITEHTCTILEDDQGIRWEGKMWYFTNENADDYKRLFINEDGDLEWWPQQKGHIVCRIPNQVLSQGPAVMEYMLMTDGPHYCGGCACSCFEESITCVAGTSDFRIVLAEADGEYIDYDQYSVGNDVFRGYRGVQFRLGPNMNASPTRWVDCHGETHKTGTINVKPVDSENLAHSNDDPELRVLPGFETPPGQYSYFKVSVDAGGYAEVTLNGRTYGAGGAGGMNKVDVFAIYMRNGRPYTRFVLRSLKECPGDFNRDFNVDSNDLKILSRDWLEQGSYELRGTAPDGNGLTVHYDFNSTLGEDVLVVPDLVSGINLGAFGDSQIRLQDNVSLIYGQPNPWLNTGTSAQFNNINADGPADNDPGIGLFAPDPGVDSVIDLSMVGAFSVEAFIKPRTIRQSVIIRKYGGGLWYLDLRPDGRVAFAIYDDNNAIFTGAGSIEADTWYHVAGVFDESDAETPMKVYLNGVLENVGHYNHRPSDSTRGLGVGCIVRDNSIPPADSGQFFDGMIDDIKVYNYALSEDEIIYEAHNGPRMIHAALDSPADAVSDDIINLRDFAYFAQYWLDECEY